MSDERAAEKITHVAPRAIDVNRWLLVYPSNYPDSQTVRLAVLRQFGDVKFCSDVSPRACGAIFVAEDYNAISAYASTLLQYFFKRDGAEARVFEFCKFTHHFFARRLDEVVARTV